MVKTFCCASCSLATGHVIVLAIPRPLLMAHEVGPPTDAMIVSRLPWMAQAPPLRCLLWVNLTRPPLRRHSPCSLDSCRSRNGPRSPSLGRVCRRRVSSIISIKNSYYCRSQRIRERTPCGGQPPLSTGRGSRRLGSALDGGARRQRPHVGIDAHREGTGNRPLNSLHKQATNHWERRPPHRTI